MCWAAQPSLQLVDRRLIRNYIDSAATVERPERDKSRQTSAIRKGSIAPIPARRPPGPLWRDDHRVSARAPALRRVRVGAVPGRGRGARPAAEPTHGDATAGQDPQGRSRNAARRQQPRDKGVLSGAVAVRSDLLRRLRASSPPQGGHRVEFELAWAPHLLSTMDYTYRERHGEAIYRFKHGMPVEPRSTLRHMGTGLHAV
jgi:hypothetical protein